MKASILFLAYNQSRFVAQAIRAAMAQDYSNLELVVCDDASPDDTRSVLEEELKHCPPHITLVRAHSQTNAGLLANFNRCMAVCSGEIVVAMAGDDISLPHRVSRLMEVFGNNPRCMLVYSNYVLIDAAGDVLPGSCKHREDKTFAYGLQPACVYAGGKGPGAAAGYRADIFRTFGPLDVCNRPEDRSCWVRALLLGEIQYLAEPLLKWRTHAGNMTNYLGGLSTMAAQLRIMKDLRMRQSYGRQFTRDIDHAVRHSSFPPKLANRLRHMIRTDRELERLRRYSLAEAPWPLWLGSAARLMKVSPSAGNLWRIAFGDLPIRLSAGKRERHWSRKIRKSQG
jgi:glycosyltransferase involved in cell wall biosynthesis